MKIQVGDKGSMYAKVFLDGKELKKCIAADEEAGECRCLIENEIKILKGVVKVDMCQ